MSNTDAMQHLFNTVRRCNMEALELKTEIAQLTNSNEKLMRENEDLKRESRDDRWALEEMGEKARELCTKLAKCSQEIAGLKKIIKELEETNESLTQNNKIKERWRQQ